MTGGDLFSVQCRNISVTRDEKGLPAGGYALIALSASGQGMSPSAKKHAFKPLFIAKFPVAGTGLGLAQVVATCEQGVGAAKIANSIKVRLRFSVTLGSNVRKSSQNHRYPSRLAQRRRPLTTCSLSRTMRRRPQGVALRSTCSDVPYGHAATADEALDLLVGGAAFDFILSDVQVPEKLSRMLSGIDLAEQVGSM